MKLDLTWLRPAMCYLVKVRKKKQKEVAALFGVKSDTVSAALKRFNETENHFIKKSEWPTSSPDLNPLDYTIWSIIESEVGAEAHENVESLKLLIIWTKT